MDSADIIDYFATVLKQFRKKFKITLAMPVNKEIIHDLRLSIKKIKAFLIFMNHVDNHFDHAKAYKPWQKLFKATGECRESQLMYDYILKKIGDPDKIKIKTNVNGDLNLRKFKKIFDKNLTVEIRRKCSEVLKTANVKAKSRMYLEEMIEASLSIIRLNEGQRIDKQHELRKLLKELRYNLRFLKSSSWLLWDEKNNTNIKSFVSILGDWHDRKSMLAELKEKDSKVIFMEENPGIKDKLEYNLISDCNALQKRINKICNDKDMINSLFPSFI